MKRSRCALLATSLALLSLTVAFSPACRGKEGPEQAEKAKIELPTAVDQAVKANVPGAEIKKMTVEKEAGLDLYDIEFEDGRGEIEVAADGTVMDIAAIIDLNDVPAPAAEAIKAAAEGAKIGQVEKSEVRAEIRMDGKRGEIVKLDIPKTVYEAELLKGEMRAEIQVGPDGRVVEAPEWGAGEGEEKEESGGKEEAEEDEAGEKEEAEEAKADVSIDLGVLPAAVLNAFKTAYPAAEIKGLSKETENGRTVYEIESVDGKMNRDLLYAADGKILEIEEALAPGALPAAVLKTLAEAHPGYKILKAEEMTKDGASYFELSIQVKGEKLSLTLDPLGKIVEK